MLDRDLDEAEEQYQNDQHGDNRVPVPNVLIFPNHASGERQFFDPFRFLFQSRPVFSCLFRRSLFEAQTTKRAKDENRMLEKERLCDLIRFDSSLLLF